MPIAWVSSEVHGPASPGVRGLEDPRHRGEEVRQETFRISVDEISSTHPYIQVCFEMYIQNFPISHGSLIKGKISILISRIVQIWIPYLGGRRNLDNSGRIQEEIWRLFCTEETKSVLKLHFIELLNRCF